MPTSTPSEAAEAVFSKSDSRPVGDMRAVQTSLNCCRTSVYKLMREDPEFPAPFTMPPVDKLTWFLDEIEKYKATRPRRVYTTAVAMVAVVSTAVRFLFSAPWA